MILLLLNILKERKYTVITMEKRVLAFYYAWYGTPWGPAGKWLGWNAHGYDPNIVIKGKRVIATPHYPLDGVYDSCDEYTLRRQVTQAKEAGIDGFIVSWWGFEHYSHKSLEKLLKIAPSNFITIYYETAMTLDIRKRNRKEATMKIYKDLRRLLTEYAVNDSWIKVNNKPLLVIYIAATYTVNEWKSIRKKLEKEGYELFILGDTFQGEYLEVFDGLHTYTTTGYTVRGVSIKDLYMKVSSEIKAKNKLFAATVCPGYDDRKIRKPGIFIPREDGRYYIDCWKASLNCNADWILVTSWNEWFEGTEIEPSIEYGHDYLYLTRMYVKIFKEQHNKRN